MSSFRRQLIVVFVLLVAVGVSTGFLLSRTQKAQSAQPPQWTGLAGLANHACYHHGLVQEIVMDGDSDEADAVCADHWSFNLSEGSWDANN